jgi:hypothetical protein
MSAALLLAALAWHWTPPTPDLPDGLVEAIVHVESRGHTMARNACCSGLMQVARRFSRFPAWALHIPAVNRLEGVRILRRWRRRCRQTRDARPRVQPGVLVRASGASRVTGPRGPLRERVSAPRSDVECALRAYATGNRALRDPQHGRPYAVAVLRRVKQ